MALMPLSPGSSPTHPRYLNPAATPEEKDAVLDSLALMMHPSIEAVREVFNWLPEAGQYKVTSNLTPRTMLAST
jgi:hypothetical protein